MCIGPVALALIDAAVTLFGQSLDYWDGYATVREDNPVAYAFLRFHPLVFAIGTAIWISLFTAAIHVLPMALARVVAFVVMLGHAIGASTWLIRWRFGIVWVLVFLVLVRMLDNLIWRSRLRPRGSGGTP
jgi:hypothetical protein